MTLSDINGNRNAEVSTSPPDPLSKNAPTTTAPTSSENDINVSVTGLDIGLTYFERINTKGMKPEYENINESNWIPAERLQPLGIDIYDDTVHERLPFYFIRHPQPKHQHNDPETTSHTFEFVIRSPYLLEAFRHVTESDSGISWNTPPVTVRYHIRDPTSDCLRLLY